jgi:hypothetical protein
MSLPALAGALPISPGKNGAILFASAASAAKVPGQTVSFGYPAKVPDQAVPFGYSASERSGAQVTLWHRRGMSLPALAGALPISPGKNGAILFASAASAAKVPGQTVTLGYPARVPDQAVPFGYLISGL